MRIYNIYSAYSIYNQQVKMSKTYDAIIAGAGPVGLILACELALAGSSVLVLERDSSAESPYKSLPLGLRGLHMPAMEALYRRGLMDKTVVRANWVPPKGQSGFRFGGHYAGILINANKFELDRWKYRLEGPALAPAPTNMALIEKVLAERAESLGVTILRGHEITGITSQGDDGVTVEAGGHSFHGRWLVGCDGGHSAVRKAAGFDFVGTDPSFTGYGIQCDFDHPEKLEKGFHATEKGLYIVTAEALHLADFENATFDRTQEITLEHIQEVFRRITGIADAKPTKIHLATTYTDRAMQAATYRKGRVLVAGDAAHIHGPLGGQGMNAGIGDAVNLGWKLAATIRQEATSSGAPLDFALLDTYESERHPAGAKVLEWTRSQAAALQPGLRGVAVRSLIRDMLDTADGANLFMDRIWGLGLRYTPTGEDAHPAVGRSAPDFEFEDGVSLGPKLESGRGLFVDFRADAAVREAIGLDGYEARVGYLGMAAKDQCGLRALLIRPDGIVSWAVNDGVELDVEAVVVALKEWFKY